MKLKLALLALAVTFFVGSYAFAPAPAHAGGREAAAFLGGLFVGGAVATAARPTYTYDYGYPVVRPQPVYVQPVCRWQKVQIWDPYVGHYVWRKQQVCG
jgi:hypothetical protein